MEKGAIEFCASFLWSISRKFIRADHEKKNNHCHRKQQECLKEIGAPEEMSKTFLLVAARVSMAYCDLHDEE